MKLCPREGIDLTERQVRGLFVSQCATCSGLWIPASVVATVIDGVSHSTRMTGGVTGFRQCPEDKSALVPIHYHGVEIDRCALCGGVWLDHGELEIILRKKRVSTVVGNALDAGSEVLSTVDPTVLGDLAGDALGAVLEFVAEALSAF
jgi:Zn-finger nucleic acid-binding protein